MANAFAVDVKPKEDMITSSPSFISERMAAISSAWLQEGTTNAAATANFSFKKLLHLPENLWLPENFPVFRTSLIYSISLPVIAGLLKLIIRLHYPVFSLTIYGGLCSTLFIILMRYSPIIPSENNIRPEVMSDITMSEVHPETCML